MVNQMKAGITMTRPDTKERFGVDLLCEMEYGFNWQGLLNYTLLRDQRMQMEIYIIYIYISFW